mmetsp:Transcript_24776/g.43296  ORF Transcript_24776/g.43296 Transcript_24776/m.43296 type:complete len:256 (-) Transcript_24776:305-1072(-)
MVEEARDLVAERVQGAEQEQLRNEQGLISDGRGWNGFGDVVAHLDHVLLAQFRARSVVLCVALRPRKCGRVAPALQLRQLLFQFLFNVVHLLLHTIEVKLTLVQRLEGCMIQIHGGVQEAVRAIHPRPRGEKEVCPRHTVHLEAKGHVGRAEHLDVELHFALERMARGVVGCVTSREGIIAQIHLNVAATVVHRPHCFRKLPGRPHYIRVALAALEEGVRMDMFRVLGKARKGDTAHLQRSHPLVAGGRHRELVA